jgi:hypothetical protein
MACCVDVIFPTFISHPGQLICRRLGIEYERWLAFNTRIRDAALGAQTTHETQEECLSGQITRDG